MTIFMGYLSFEELPSMTEKFEDRLTAPSQGLDPSNTDTDELTAPLEAEDNVYTLVFQDQGDIREAAPVGEEQSGE